MGLPLIQKLPLFKDRIEKLIPHSGAMCLIDRVDDWDEDSIRCTSISHQDPNNPLRLDNELSSIHLLEYGAQAMAIHGGLLTKTASPGVLAAVRDVNICIEKLDHVEDEIITIANVELNTETGAIYRFTITDTDSNTLLNARATVINHWEHGS